MGGVILILLALDIVWFRLLTDYFRELLFRPDDTQLFENRDVMWGWTMMVGGILMFIWAAKENASPTIWLTAQPDGLGLGVRSPGGTLLVIPWRKLSRVWVDELTEDEERYQVLRVEVNDPSLFPLSVLNGRRVSDTEIAVFTYSWNQDPGAVVELIAAWQDASPRQRFQSGPGPLQAVSEQVTSRL